MWRRLAIALPIAIGVAIAYCSIAVPVASAATTCHVYGAFHSGDDGAAVERNRRVCAAPASDFPTYSGWGRFVVFYETYRVDQCDGQMGILPRDQSVPAAGFCATVASGARSTVPAWRWNPGQGWVSASVGASSSALTTGSRAYLAPFATGWRWAWTQQTGWVAVEERYTAFRWYA